MNNNAIIGYDILTQNPACNLGYPPDRNAILEFNPNDFRRIPFSGKLSSQSYKINDRHIVPISAGSARALTNSEGQVLDLKMLENRIAVNALLTFKDEQVERNNSRTILPNRPTQQVSGWIAAGKEVAAFVKEIWDLHSSNRLFVTGTDRYETDSGVFVGKIEEGKIVKGTLFVLSGQYNIVSVDAASIWTGSVELSQGERYIGQTVNGIPHGYGSFTHPNGVKYVGNFENGIASGKGVVEHPNGTIYNGEWLNDFRHGKGVEIYPKGDVFKGEWKNGIVDGYGLVTLGSKVSYEGYFKNYKANGLVKKIDEAGLHWDALFDNGREIWIHPRIEKAPSENK
jgi:hypothetical protein